jgi:TRAP-type C4-dicarboxylate transport system substrate-binding protein
MCRDQGFLDGLDRELNKYVKRLSKKAETVASQVSPEQEEGDAALMRDAAKYNKNDKRKRAQDREVMREVVSEFKGKTAKEE